MSAESENSSQKSLTSNQVDEIDLRAFLKEIGQLFERMGNSIILLLIWLRRQTLDHVVFFIITVILVTGFQFAQQKLLNPPNYSSTMIFRSEHLNGPLLEKYLEKLNQDIASRSNLLQIDSSIAKLIIQFTVEPFVTEDEIIEFELFKQELLTKISEEDASTIIEKLRLENRSTYQIGVLLSGDSTELLGQIEESLLRYIADNRYVKKRLELEKLELEARKQMVQKEMNQLDSLKSILLANLITQARNQDKGSNNVILRENPQTDPINVFRENMSYYYIEQGIERQLYLRPSFEVLDGFNVLKRSDNRVLWENPLQTLLLALSIAYVILFLFQFNKYLVGKEQRSKASSD